MNEAAVESFSSHYIKGPCKVLSEDDDASEATEAVLKLLLFLTRVASDNPRRALLKWRVTSRIRSHCSRPSIHVRHVDTI